MINDTLFDVAAKNVNFLWYIYADGELNSKFLIRFDQLNIREVLLDIISLMGIRRIWLMEKEQQIPRHSIQIEFIQN